ncbi:MAG: diheme cytochrome c [Burkholderiales bacterium]|nr:diheme cytochrome c [Burkholderiales bacterium]
MSHQPRLRLRQGLFGLMAALLLTQASMADDDERATRAPLLPKYQQECSSCHLAYPPGMLPAASWQRLMNNLPKHYGTDASLDPATVKQLSTWLTANAGNYRRVREEPPQDRITRSAWFIHKHDEVPASTWKRPAIKSAANCMACHTGAEKGDYDEDRVRIPR